MTRILTAAQIGCGKFAWAQDLPNLTAHPGVRLKWACDAKEDNAKHAAEQFHIPRTAADFMAVIRDKEVDFIKIATSHEVHLPIIEAAARAGKHVFCEKPLAMHEDEACRIIRAVRRGGIKLCVDFNRRLAPALSALRVKWLAHAAHPQHNPWRYIEQERELLPEENLPHLLIRIQDESSSYSPAHLDPLTGGGLIIGESVHWLDLACQFFAPQRPCAITAWGSSRLSHGIHLQFDGGASMTLDFSCAGTFDFPKELYEVSHHAALFRSLCFVENNYYGMPDNTPEYFKLQYDPHPEEGDGFAAFLRKYRAHVASGSAKAVENSSPLLADKGHRRLLDEFVLAVRNGAPSPCDELAGFRATYLAQRAIEALELQRTLSIPLEKITPAIT